MNDIEKLTAVNNKMIAECEVLLEAAVVLANKYHKKMHEECPPPYAAVDAGKVHGLLTAIQSLQAENAELREALKPFAHPDLHKLYSSNVSGDESIVYCKDNAELKIKHFRKAAELVNGDTQ